MVRMATTITAFPFLLSISIFFFLSCSPFPATASSAEVPLSVSAKSTAVQYWNRVVASNSHPPTVLLAHLSSISTLDLIIQLKETGVAFGDEATDHATTGEDAKSLDNIGAADGEARESHLYNYHGGSDDKHTISFSPDLSSMYGHSQATDADMGRAADGEAKESRVYNYHGGSDDKHTISFSPDATSMYGHSQATDADMGRSADGEANESHLYNYHGGSDDKHTVSYSPDVTSMYGHNQATTDADMGRAADDHAKKGLLYHGGREAYGVARENHLYNYHGGSDDVHACIFFRESQLKRGTTMPVADFGGERPHLNFLPRYIATRVPLSADAVMNIFHIPPDSSMGKAVAITIDDCKRAPMEGETRRCITSAEDMIDYVVASLGAESNVTARSTENSNGMGSSVLIGEVKAVNGGKLGHAVSCHQTMFPYLLYQCHSVPKTNLYEVEILDPETEEEINRATAICHFDTSQWSPGHEAFVALGSEPGTEVCHWIYPRNMAWTAAAE